MDENYNYLAIGNSITLHGKTDYWWNECGMAATDKENDYVHKLVSMLEKRESKVDVYAYNLHYWELQATDRGETLSQLDNMLSDKLNLVTLQLGENVTDLSTFQEDFNELINYVKEKAPNATIAVIGDFWTYENRDDIKRNVSKECEIEYIDLNEIKDNENYQAGMGTKVYGDDGTEHIIEHEGIAGHPGDNAMNYIAEKIYQAIK
ncbi:SGNH/GDSL hydrolase family protein [Clostridiaceae bacterium AM27-36LB]|nr:SGNH/GDSL hydrolase family protein [Clostridiaceae bacterium AM27-36LB]